MKLIPSSQLAAELVQWKPQGIYFRDDLYYCPEPSWIPLFNQYLQPFIDQLEESRKAKPRLDARLG